MQASCVSLDFSSKGRVAFDFFVQNLAFLVWSTSCSCAFCDVPYSRCIGIRGALSSVILLMATKLIEATSLTWSAASTSTACSRKQKVLEIGRVRIYQSLSTGMAFASTTSFLSRLPWTCFHGTNSRNMWFKSHRNRRARLIPIYTLYNPEVFVKIIDPCFMTNYYFE